MMQYNQPQLDIINILNNILTMSSLHPVKQSKQLCLKLLAGFAICRPSVSYVLSSFYNLCSNGMFLTWLKTGKTATLWYETMYAWSLDRVLFKYWEKELKCIKWLQMWTGQHCKWHKHSYCTIELVVKQILN